MINWLKFSYCANGSAGNGLKPGCWTLRGGGWIVALFPGRRLKEKNIIGLTIPWQVVFRYEIRRISWNPLTFIKSGRFHVKSGGFHMLLFFVLSQICLAVSLLPKFVHIGDPTWHCFLTISRPLRLKRAACQNMQVYMRFRLIIKYRSFV